MVFTWMGDFSKMNRTAPDDRYTVGLIKSEVPSPNDNYLVDWLIPRSAQSINDGHIYYWKKRKQISEPILNIRLLLKETNKR